MLQSGRKSSNPPGWFECEKGSDYALGMQVKVTLAEMRTVPAWLSLASKVEPLFGPMPNFDSVVERKILRKQAFYALVDNKSTSFAGGVLIGGSGNEHWIRWLAVCPDFRKVGVGRSLVEAALQRIPPSSDVFVDTFVAGSSGGEAARHLYKNFGFEPIGSVEIEGRPRDRFKRRGIR